MENAGDCDRTVSPENGGRAGGWEREHNDRRGGILENGDAGILTALGREKIPTVHAAVMSMCKLKHHAPAESFLARNKYLIFECLFEVYT